MLKREKYQIFAIFVVFILVTSTMVLLFSNTRSVAYGEESTNTPTYTQPDTTAKETIIIVDETTPTETTYEEIEETAAVIEETIPTITIHEETVVEEEEPSISDYEIYLLALLTVAEAEGEFEYGKRLVIDTVLNRVDHEYFPNTIADVIYEPKQFTSVWNGRVEECVVTDEVIQLVKEELVSRTNYDVIFFRADRYSDYGSPLFQAGNHWFSSYK